jgi:hypothetical protein
MRITAASPLPETALSMMRAVSTARCSATTLTFDALYEVALALNTDRATDVIYTDGDYVSPGGEAMTHLFEGLLSMWFEFVLLPDSRHSAGMNSLLLGQLSRGPM